MQAGSIAAGTLSAAYTFGTDDVGPGRLRLHDQIQAELRPDRLQRPPISPRMRNPLLVRFLRAILRGGQWIHTQKEDTVRIITKRFKFSEKHSAASWR